MKPFTISNDCLCKPDLLRTRAATDGYLFFKGLVPCSRLKLVRGEILTICARHRWLKEGEDSALGIAREDALFVEPEPGFQEVYSEVMKLESFHALAHEPAILSMLAQLFGEAPLVHARNIARIIFPNAVQHTTPAHQDFIHIQGTPETWTAWMPLSDCPQSLGSLTVLAGSQREGIFPVHPSAGAGGVGIDTEGMPYEWVGSDFTCGDALFFHSKVVHRGLPNLSEDKIRVSVDFRYQGESQPIVASSLEPHHGRLGWDEVYEGWHSTRYQYYWKRQPVNLVEWSPQYHEAARKSSITNSM